MDITLSLASETLADDELQALTREFSATLNQETDIAAAMPETPPEPGARGDAVSLYTLLLTFMSSGTAVALFEVAKAYFERDASLSLKFKRADGQELVLEQRNTRPGEVERTLGLVREFFCEES